MMQLVVHFYPQRRTTKTKVELLDLGVGGLLRSDLIFYCYNV
jgi:hypothetical protein